MIRKKVDRMRIELDIGFFENYFHADELSCVDQPIAAYTELLCKSAYYFYSLYVIFSENWYYPLEKGFFESREQILSKIGLKIEQVNIQSSDLLVDVLKEQIELLRPVILYLHRKTIVYDQVYGDPNFDSIHGIMVTGYNSSYPVMCIRDAAHIENSGADYKGSGYGLFRLWLKADILKEMWQQSFEISPTDEYAKKIIMLEVDDPQKMGFSLEQAFRDILSNGSLQKDKFAEWLRLNRQNINMLEDDEISREIRRNYILPKNAFFRILLMLCLEKNKYDLECYEIHKRYMDLMRIIINRFCISAKRGKDIKTEIYENYLRKIEKMNKELEKFIYHVLEGSKI